MLKNLSSVLIVFTVCRADLLFPEKGQELNYIHVLFNWDQEPNAVLYNLQISSSESFDNILLDIHEETTAYIEKDIIEWESTYYWRVGPIYNNGNNGPWSEESYFTTGEPNTSGQDVDIYNNDLIQDGVIVYGWVTGAIDRFGNEIWNTEYFLMNHINQYGQLYGQMGVVEGGELTQGGELNFYNQFLWMSPEGTEVDRHEIIQIPNGNYMGFIYVYQLGPISLGDWSQNFQDLGYAADGVTNEFQWRGCKIIEWDQETGEEVWSWDPFDHFSMDDHDLYGATWWIATNSWHYDWMHSNALHFDEVNSVIYVSNRNLSRISKISYPSGDVIWNMGLPTEYNTGDENICTDLLFSFQHHIQLLDDGDLLFFDNGNLSQMLLGDPNPISRIRRIRVIDDSYCETIWEYALPQNLYGSAKGSVQLLDNGNYFIYSLGNGLGEFEPSVFEITPDRDIVWKATADYLNTHWYRAYKVPSIHPNGFSVLFDQYYNMNVDGNSFTGVVLDDADTSLSFTIHNQSGYSQSYTYTLSDNNGWFNVSSDTVTIGESEHLIIALDPIVEPDSITVLTLNIWPIYHEYAMKSINYDVFHIDGVLNVIEPIIPTEYALFHNYPNPFNSITRLRYYIPEEINVKITIYDIMGKVVKTLINSSQNSGYKSIRWNATDNKGQPVGTGVYLYRIETGKFRQTKKMILLK